MQLVLLVLLATFRKRRRNEGKKGKRGRERERGREGKVVVVKVAIGIERGYDIIETVVRTWKRNQKSGMMEKSRGVVRRVLFTQREGVC